MLPLNDLFYMPMSAYRQILKMLLTCSECSAKMHNMTTASDLAATIRAAVAAGDSALHIQFLRDCWCAVTYGDLTDRELSDWMFAVDAHIIEHDAYCCCDEFDPCVGRERRLLASLSHEADRRVRYGLMAA